MAPKNDVIPVDRLNRHHDFYLTDLLHKYSHLDKNKILRPFSAKVRFVLFHHRLGCILLSRSTSDSFA